MKEHPAFDERGLPRGYRFNPEREVTPRQVREKLDLPEKPVNLIDCREPHEWEITRIEGARLLPLSRLSEQFEEAFAGAEEQEIIIYCRVGGRSLQLAEALRRRGFSKAYSMAGGILAWNQVIEPGRPLY